MNKTTRSHNLKKLTLGLATSALVALPLLASTAQNAVAQPNYRNQQNRNNHGNYNYGNYNNNAATRGSMAATVTSNPNGNRFTVRADDNRTFTVQSRTNTGNLRVGDRVQLNGILTNGNVFVADSFSVLSSANNNYGNGTYNRGNYGRGIFGNGTNSDRGTMDATVTSVSSSNRFTVRADDNRTFTVQANNTRSVRVGDRVQVAGYIRNGNLFVADSVSVISGSGRTYRNRAGGIYGNGNGATVDFYGTVQSMNGNYVQVRGDNGQTYNVLRNNDSTFNRGERIRVIGTSNRRGVQASSITRY